MPKKALQCYLSGHRCSGTKPPATAAYQARPSGGKGGEEGSIQSLFCFHRRAWGGRRGGSVYFPPTAIRAAAATDQGQGRKITNFIELGKCLHFTRGEWVFPKGGNNSKNPSEERRGCFLKGYKIAGTVRKRLL